ncbi:MAG: ATP-binding cassette domain-containing protein [Candidatus Colwellbacteria bacterium]|nr:ATP-binding cassette domain-containing protein [Candidatus Colwellbacteria bacterium]MCK9497558.1 ATP-binding cassette domain-containing protein [Candidatus Colwellbacteria bacterium]MDD3752594.1 ATP-binding cassette domain-containing protein [Candidatus Colwellbacteria bacterium]
MKVITFNNVSKKYGSNEVVKEASFKINPGEFVSLVGKSGAGKSTLIKMLIGEEKPSKGRVIFGQYEVNKLSNKELPELRRHMGVIFQDFRLLPKKTAYENVVFAMEVAGRPQKEIDEVTPQVLDLVGLATKKHNFIHELSGGERQRVAIARAMVNHPDVIIADEPTGNLDPINTWGIINLLMKINELGTTVILATHNKEIVNQLEKRVISMEDGKVIRDDEKGKYILV